MNAGDWKPALRQSLLSHLSNVKSCDFRMRAFLPPVSLVGNHAWRFGKSGGANESVGMDALQNSRGQFQVRSLSPAPDSCSKASLGERSFSFLAAPSGIPLRTPRTKLRLRQINSLTRTIGRFHKYYKLKVNI